MYGSYEPTTSLLILADEPVNLLSMNYDPALACSKYESLLRNLIVGPKYDRTCK